jgi:hypothetical protein
MEVIEKRGRRSKQIMLGSRSLKRTEWKGVPLEQRNAHVERSKCRSRVVDIATILTRQPATWIGDGYADESIKNNQFCGE